MADPSITILDSSLSEDGVTQIVTDSYSKADVYVTLAIYIGSGDSVVLEGKVDQADSFITVQTYTESTLTQVRLPTIFRARRSVDGGSADSVVKVQNNYNLNLTAAS